MPLSELDMFLSAWDREATSTLKLLRALPASQYDFRPDTGGRIENHTATTLDAMVGR